MIKRIVFWHVLAVAAAVAVLIGEAEASHLPARREVPIVSIECGAFYLLAVVLPALVFVFLNVPPLTDPISRAGAFGSRVVELLQASLAASVAVGGVLLAAGRVSLLAGLAIPGVAMPCLVVATLGCGNVTVRGLSGRQVLIVSVSLAVAYLVGFGSFRAM